ncbi:MAG: hypothetical protein M1816_004235 [Peltula sp. TS41687]|nr:MAG: hypothetical protein M1816_004235 [Peltula sp. TS41687]
MHPICWTPDQCYVYTADPEDETSEPFEEYPPPYDQMGSTPPPFPPFDPNRPDYGFPYGVLPMFGGFQPMPPPPPPPPPAPAAPAPATAPPAPLTTIPSSHVDPAAAGVNPGISYLYPAKHTSLHVIAGSFVPYESPHVEFQFSIVRVPCNMTVAELIEQLGADGANDKVTECVELGEGAWAKGASIVKSNDMAKKTLAQVGWDEDRGEGPKPPVWICVSRG